MHTSMFAGFVPAVDERRLRVVVNRRVEARVQIVN